MTDYQLLPPLSAEEYAALKADIAARGVLVPVEFDEDGAVLDGHHRLAVWEELRAAGIEVPPYPRVVRTGLSEADKVAHVLALNLARRHLSREERAATADRLRDQGWKNTDIAARLGVTTMTLWRDRQPPDLTNVMPATRAPSPYLRSDEESEAYIERLHTVRDAVVGALENLPPWGQPADPPPEERAMSEYFRLMGLVRINRFEPALIAGQLSPLAAGNDASRVAEFIDWLRRLEAALRKPTLRAVREADA